MDVKMRAIIMFLSMLKMLVSVKTLEHSILQKQKLPKEDCDLLVVSPMEADEGRASLVSKYFFQSPFFRFWKRYNQVWPYWKTAGSKGKCRIQVSDRQNVLFDDNCTKAQWLWSFAPNWHRKWTRDRKEKFANIHRNWKHHIFKKENDELQCDCKP